jgi:putative spermidine/putrescine transport system permease protein
MPESGIVSEPALPLVRPRRRSLAECGFDGVTLLALPAALFVLLLFVYPFLYGLALSFAPKTGDWFANYTHFFADPYMYRTIWLTLRLALPVTVLNIALSVPIAMQVRHMPHQRLLTTILVLPITLGTVLVAEGLLNYLGPHGWFNRTLVSLGLIDRPIRLVQNYWGVFLSLIVTGFPFTFLLTLSMISGIDPALEQAAATLGARAHQRFRQIVLPLIIPGLAVIFCLAFVDAFSVFPTAVMIGAPAGETRVISLAASQAAFEQYDYSYASAIAMIMAAVQLGFVAAVLGLRGLFYKGPADGGKG